MELFEETCRAREHSVLQYTKANEHQRAMHKVVHGVLGTIMCVENPHGDIVKSTKRWQDMSEEGLNDMDLWNIKIDLSEGTRLLGLDP